MKKGVKLIKYNILSVMECPHCGANLDEGDVLEHFLIKYGEYTKAIETARLYGWSETNKARFNRSIIVQN